MMESWIINMMVNYILNLMRSEIRHEYSLILRKLYNEELHNLYSSPSIIRIIKSRRMRWAGHVARMGKRRNAY
jgi:hypothetical protein